MKALTKATSKLFKPVRISNGDRCYLEINDEGTHFVATFYEERKTFDGKTRRGWPSHNVQRHLLPRFPERKDVSGGFGSGGLQFELGATDYTAEILRHSWPGDQLLFANEATRITYQYLLLTSKQLELNADLNAVFRVELDREIETGTKINPAAIKINEHEYNDEYPLATYQQVGLENSMRSEGFALFMEQGTGKTPIVIARIMNEAAKLREGYEDHRGLELKREQLVARYTAKIDAACKAIDEAIERDTESELNRRKRQAKADAERQFASIHHEGTVVGVLAKAKDAIASAEGWLKQKIQEVNAQEPKIRRELTAAAEIDKRKVTAEFSTEMELKIGRLTPKRIPPEKRMYRALIVCPNNVRLNWFNEVFKFATRPGKVQVIRGDQVGRIRCLTEAMMPEEDCEYTICIISYDGLIRSWSVLQRIPWDLSVLDESHYIKSPQTKRWKYAQKLRDVSKSRMVLTGTPITNHMLDLWTQFEFLCQGWSGFVNWKKFREFYGVFKPGKNGHDKLEGFQNLPFMQERLSRQAFIVKKREVLRDMPEKVYDVEEVTMSKQQAAVYDQLRTQLAVEIEGVLADDTRNRSMVIQNVLTKLLRLAQVASGFVKWDDVVGDDGEVLQAGFVEQFDPNPKIERLVEIIKSRGKNSKTLIWACWVPFIKALEQRFIAEGIDCVSYYGGTNEKQRALNEHRFNNDDNCKVFIGHPAAGGTGLNLLGYPPGQPEASDCNVDLIIYPALNWSSTQRSQSEDRGHRRGTRVQVRIMDLCVAGSIDEMIRDRVMQKISAALTITDLREILHNVLEGVLDD